jgi:hypothetical protein
MMYHLRAVEKMIYILIQDGKIIIIPEIKE